MNINSHPLNTAMYILIDRNDRKVHSKVMTNTPTTQWQTETATAIAGLDADLDELLAAVRAFRTKAARATKRIAARAERLAESIYDAHEASNALLPIGVYQPMAPSDEHLLGKLAWLPSGSPEDVASAFDALAEYRSTLSDLARQAGELAPADAIAA